jgi:DNA-binding response OmpR family regulator
LTLVCLIERYEVCARLREWTQVPIIILSVRDSERDKVAV